MHFIFNIGAFQAFILSLLLLTKKEKKEADKFLAGFFFILQEIVLNFCNKRLSIVSNE